VIDTVLESLAAGITNPRDRAIVQMLIDTGLRGGDIVGLDRNMVSVDPDGNGGRAEFFEAKSSTKRTLPFGPRSARALDDYLRLERSDDDIDVLFLAYGGKRLTVTQLSRIIGRWCAKLGIERITLPQFRSAFAIRFMNGAGSPEVLATLMGCSSFKSIIRRLGVLDESAMSQEYSRAMKTASATSAC
jgi:integrase